MESNNGGTITKQWIETEATNNGLINLIKAYREVSHKGLKESKDAIDTTRIPLTPTTFNIPKLIELFAEYIPELRTKKPNHLKTHAKLIKVMKTAIRYSDDMGFTNVYDALRMVIRNFDMEYKTIPVN